MIFKGTTSSLTPDQRGRGKSRRDGTLPRTSYTVQVLTVDFNLRGGDAARYVSTSPAGTTLIAGGKCRPCGTWEALAEHLVRRLKSTVNKVLSLRDSAQLVNLLQVVNSAFHTPDFNYTDFGTIKVK